jgi:hypothetical protein
MPTHGRSVGIVINQRMLKILQLLKTFRAHVSIQCTGRVHSYQFISNLEGRREISDLCERVVSAWQYNLYVSASFRKAKKAIGALARKSQL